MKLFKKLAQRILGEFNFIIIIMIVIIIVTNGKNGI